MEQLKFISNDIIRQFHPCYDPAKVTESEAEQLPVVEWVQKYRNLVDSPSDILWLLCRNEFVTDRDLRLFAVWCARSTYELCTENEPIDPLSIEAVNVAERYASGEATYGELSAARSAAWSAAWSAARSAAESAAESAARSAARSAAGLAAELAAESAARSAAWLAAESAARSAAWSAQIDQLLTYFV